MIMHHRSTDEVMAEMKKTLNGLQTMRDETKLKVHLASMDLKQAWEALQPKLEEAERVVMLAAGSATEASLEAMKATANELEKLAAAL
jgi:hypothetical protein